MKNPVRTYGANIEGRDFVIGDLHGSYSVFQNLLQNLQFDPLKDRMFSVGDLVDRGPDNIECLELLYEPWFHTVMSNHEQMMWEAFHGGYMGQFWMRNDGAWGAEAMNDWHNRAHYTTNKLELRIPSDSSVRLWEALDLVRELPFIMTVKLLNGRQVHIIHAELPPGNVITDEVLADPVKTLELATVQSSDGDFFAWGRHIFYHFYNTDLSDLAKVKRTVAYHHGKRNVFNDKLSHVISGHTIIRRPMTILGQTNIDTCAYGSLHPKAAKWEALTCVELNTWKFYQATATEFREVEPLVVTSDDIDPKHLVGTSA